MKRTFARIMLMAFVVASLLPSGSASASAPNAQISGNIKFNCTITIKFPQKQKAATAAQCDGVWTGTITARGDNGQTDTYIPDAQKSAAGMPIFKVYNIQYFEPCEPIVPGGPEEPVKGFANGQVSLHTILSKSKGGQKSTTPLLKQTIHAAFEYERTGTTFTATIGPNKKKTLPLHIHDQQVALKHKPKDPFKWVKHPNAAGNDGTAGGQFTPDTTPSCQETDPPQMLTIQITGTAAIV